MRVGVLSFEGWIGGVGGLDDKGLTAQGDRVWIRARRSRVIGLF